MTAKAKTRAFRDLVARALSAASGKIIHVVPEYASSGGSHLLGLPGWSLIVRNHQNLALSKVIDEARDAAEAEASSFYGAIMYRQQSENIASSYVVLDLETFSRIIRERAQHEQ